MEPEATALWATYFATRSTEARNAVYTYYHGLAFDLAYHMAGRLDLRDRDNAAAEACLHVLTRVVPAYDGRRDFHAFMARAIRNRLFDLAKRRSVCEVSLLRDPVVDSEPPEWETDEAVRSAAARELSKTQRAAWRLRYDRGKSNEETAASLGLTTRAVRRTIRAAVMRLRKSCNN